MQSSALTLDGPKESLLDIVRPGYDLLRTLREEVPEQELPVLVEVRDDDLRGPVLRIIAASFAVQLRAQFLQYGLVTFPTQT